MVVHLKGFPVFSEIYLVKKRERERALRRRRRRRRGRLLKKVHICQACARDPRDVEAVTVLCVIVTYRLWK